VITLNLSFVNGSQNKQGLFAIVKVTNKIQLYRLIYFSLSALHVSGDVFAHHQGHLTVFTVSGSIYPGCCWLVSWMSWNCREYYQIL